ncbi:hypothetical protein GLOTRDRAFT_96169 [Gloeophyllum trabeum ATCC 11539]|uniref:Uncharacterized protein n=1 Tax=Gloeophyllum trabeum (strain ATCC 11539 / FP-39264 / Madison 617) TaxID=670483 RepID=S7PX59_GLOTA|nr:uncharacterized protein GLOTRDRAFT_96169 [Gloeophyllum trabeum ATCC 11539]EPQ51957.1 hypothetical protein GLOTRDRAFT_96169 [Gloeophyllum trabeum ATCC 11539]
MFLLYIDYIWVICLVETTMEAYEDTIYNRVSLVKSILCGLVWLVQGYIYARRVSAILSPDFQSSGYCGPYGLFNTLSILSEFCASVVVVIGTVQSPITRNTRKHTPSWATNSGYHWASKILSATVRTYSLSYILGSIKIWPSMLPGVMGQLSFPHWQLIPSSTMADFTSNPAATLLSSILSPWILVAPSILATHMILHLHKVAHRVAPSTANTCHSRAIEMVPLQNDRGNQYGLHLHMKTEPASGNEVVV